MHLPLHGRAAEDIMGESTRSRDERVGRSSRRGREKKSKTSLPGSRPPPPEGHHRATLPAPPAKVSPGLERRETHQFFDFADLESIFRPANSYCLRPVQDHRCEDCRILSTSKPCPTAVSKLAIAGFGPAAPYLSTP